MHVVWKRRLEDFEALNRERVGRSGIYFRKDDSSPAKLLFVKALAFVRLCPDSVKTPQSTNLKFFRKVEQYRLFSGVTGL